MRPTPNTKASLGTLRVSDANTNSTSSIPHSDDASVEISSQWSRHSSRTKSSISTYRVNEMDMDDFASDDLPVALWILPRSKIACLHQASVRKESQEQACEGTKFDPARTPPHTAFNYPESKFHALRTPPDIAHARVASRYTHSDISGWVASLSLGSRILQIPADPRSISSMAISQRPRRQVESSRNPNRDEEGM